MNRKPGIGFYFDECQEIRSADFADLHRFCWRQLAVNSNLRKFEKSVDEFLLRRSRFFVPLSLGMTKFPSDRFSAFDPFYRRIE